MSERKIYVIRAKLPITKKKKDGSTSVCYRWHYFQGCATQARGVQGGITGEITYNSWVRHPKDCGGLMAYNDADAWLKFVNEASAQIKFYGYWDTGTRNIYDRHGNLLPPVNHMLPPDTTFRIIVKPPDNGSVNLSAVVNPN